MKLNANIFLIFILLYSVNLQAQFGKSKFEKTTHDFGKITEESKKAVYKFAFTNQGDADLKVLNVKTSCGCTASDYTKTPIKPGEKGVINVTYFTTGRPGAFRKSITVTVNNPDHPNTVLFIKGFVIPKSKSKGDFYPVTMGNLKLMSNHLAFNDIKTSEIRKDSLKVYNAWGHLMTIAFQQVPPHLTVEIATNTLKPGQEAYIYITYDASKKKDFGLIYDRIAIRTNDNVQPIKTLNISARISQDFSHLTEKELKKAPKVVFNETNHDFGTVKAGTVVTYRFEFVNEGKSTLDIMKVKTSCGCTTTKLDQKSYKKGKSGYIEAVFNTSGRKGRQHKTITIITNDPKNSEIVLTVTGELN